jgi:hypothetical protein
MAIAMTEIWNTVYHLGLKAHYVSEDVHTSFFRWSEEREECVLVGLLENVSPGIGTNLSNWPN